MVERLRNKTGDESEKTRHVFFMLLRNLGEIYRSRLNDPIKAITSFEAALRYRSKDLAVREKVARLCVRTVDHGVRAQGHYRRLIVDAPTNYAYYHSLSALYASAGNVDGAWRVASLLVLAGEALDAEQRLYEKRSDSGILNIEASFDDEVWLKYVISPGEDPLMSQLFSILYEAVQLGLGMPTVKVFGLTKKDLLRPEEHGAFLSLAQRVANLLGLDLPALYHHKSDVPIIVLPVAKPALVISETFLAHKNEKEVAFELARQMVYVHPWHLLANHFDGPGLKTVLDTVCLAWDGELPEPAKADDSIEEAQRKQFMTVMIDALSKRYSAEQKEEIGRLMGEVRPYYSMSVIEKWRREVELTAVRAGICVTNDTVCVGRLLKAEQPRQSSLTSEEKLLGLISYTLSDRYTRLRETLGIA
jgi:hypothetical protein